MAEEQRRRAELRARALRGLAALLAVAIAAAALAGWQWRESVRERRRVVVRSLARDAAALAEPKPQRAALLAAQALALGERNGEPRFAPAEEALRAALANLGGTVLGPGLPGARLLVASPEGDRLAEWGQDGKLRVWEIGDQGAAGEPVVLDGPPGAPERIDLTAGGRWLVAATERAAHLWRLGGPAGTAPVDLPLDGGRLLTVAPSPGGRWLATRTADGPLTLWSLAGEEPSGPLALAAGTAAALAHAFSKDDRRLAAGDAAGAVRLWDLAGGDEAPAAALPGGRRAVLAVALLPGGLVATGDAAGEVAVWDPAAGTRNVLGGAGGSVDRLAVSPDGGWLAARGRGASLLQRLEGGRPAGAPMRLDGPVLDLAFAADGTRLATVGRAGGLRLTRLDAAGEGAELEPTGVRSAVFGPGGWLAAGGEDGAARLWWPDGPQGASSTRLGGHEGPVTVVAFLAGGRRLATGAGGDRPRLWDLGRHDPTGPAEPAVLGGRGRTSGHAGPVLALTFMEDGRLLTGGADRKLGAWDASSEDPHPAWAELPGPPDPAAVMALTPDGRTAALATGGEVVVLGLQPGRPATVRATLPHGAPVAALALSPDGRRLATGLAAPGGGAEVRLWDLGSRPPASRLLRSHEGRVDALAWSADGRWLVTGGGGDAARLYEAAGGELPKHKLEGHGGEVTAAAWSVDGRWLATAGGDRAVRVWAIAEGEPGETPAVVLRGEGGRVRALAWSADGRWLATADDDGARLWDRERPAAGAVALPGSSGARALAVSSDGRWLMAAGERGVRRYRLRLDELVTFACRAAGRELSDTEWREHLASERRRAGEPCPVAGSE